MNKIILFVVLISSVVFSRRTTNDTLDARDMIILENKVETVTPKYFLGMEDGSDEVKTYDYETYGVDSARACHTADTALNTPDSVRACYKADTALNTPDSVRACHVADTALNTPDSVRACHVADIVIDAGAVDSTRAAWKSDTCMFYPDSVRVALTAGSAIISQVSTYSDTANYAHVTGAVDSSRAAWKADSAGFADSARASWKADSAGMSYISTTFNFSGMLSSADTFLVRKPDSSIHGMSGSDLLVAIGAAPDYSLTSGYIPYFDGTDLDDSPMYTDATSVAISTETPTAHFDVSFSGNSIAIGADTYPGGINTRTNETSKDGSITIPHYINVEEPVSVITAFTGMHDNSILYGYGTTGPSGDYNCATIHAFATAADNTTVSGTEQLRIEHNHTTVHHIFESPTIYDDETNVGIGCPSGEINTRLNVRQEDASIDTVALILALEKTSTGNHTDSNGVGMIFRSEDQYASMRDLATVEAVMVDESSPHGELVFKTMEYSTVSEAARLTHGKHLLLQGDLYSPDNSNPLMIGKAGTDQGIFMGFGDRISGMSSDNGPVIAMFPVNYGGGVSGDIQITSGTNGDSSGITLTADDDGTIKLYAPFGRIDLNAVDGIYVCNNDTSSRDRMFMGPITTGEFGVGADSGSLRLYATDEEHGILIDTGRTYIDTLIIVNEDDESDATRIDYLGITMSGGAGLSTQAPVDIRYGGAGIINGADFGASTRTNSTIKLGMMVSPHYTIAEEHVIGLIQSNTSTQNTLTFGGGHANYNANTDIIFKAAANTTTLNGTEIVHITSDGMQLTKCDNAGSDVDKFLVRDASNNTDYRTGAEVLSDIGAAPALSLTTNYIPKAASSTTLGNSQIYDNGTNVSIGHTGGTSKLDIYQGSINITRTAGSTATPDCIDLGDSYSNGTTRDKCKIYFYNIGTEQYGIGVGSSSDIQHHSNAYHDFYISNSKQMSISGTGTAFGNPTGSYKGAGTINAVAVYDDNVLLTGYPLKKEYSPSFTLAEYDSIAVKKGKPTHVPARRYINKYEINSDLDRYGKYMRDSLCLPAFEEVEKTGEIPSTGAMIQKLWETVEVQAIHIQQLNARLKILEKERAK